MDLTLLFSQLREIEGLDIWQGLAHTGRREVYAGTLRLFCVELEQKIAAAEKLLAGENWKDYATFVHAIKGGLAGTGVWLLARKAFMLEEAALRGDYAFCREESPAAFGEMAGFAASLRTTVLFAEKAGPRKKASPAFLKQKLAELYRCCSLGDSAGADAAAGELRTKTGGEEIDALVEKVCGLAENLDYDVVVETLEQRGIVEKK